MGEALQSGLFSDSLMKKMLKLLVISFCLIIVNAQDWRHKELDTNGKYHLYWRVRESTVVFQVEVATTGWVGFGLSLNGGMTGSDIVIGWISNGKTTFHDRHATGKLMPTVDEHQDWELLWSHENDTHTLIAFQREINTCDKKEDLIIQERTVKIIYAYGEEDPTSPNSVKYHGPRNRGTKSISLLENKDENINMGLPQDLLYWETRSPNVSVPDDIDTSYLCTVIKRPDMDKLHHIIKFEAVIQPGNERFVHHAILYECTDANKEMIEPLQKGYHNCYNENQIPNFSFCFTAIIVWAVGGEPIYLPKKTGLPLGRSNAVYYVLEVHYDNPGYERGIVDNSGLRIAYTPKLRKYNSGVLAVGNLWYACMFIPPKQKEFTVAGHAHPACLRLGIPPGGINVISVLLHTHIVGKKIKLRQFRGRQELSPISSDDNYDFNYQNYVMLSKEVKVLPNDHLIVECSYDTSKRNETTFGGLSTHEEMCLAFLLYYPEIQISLSTSCPFPLNLVKHLGVTQMERDDTHLISPISGKNESYIDFLNHYPWDENSVRAVQKAMKYSPHLNMCSKKGGKFQMVVDLARYPDKRIVYHEPDECLTKNPNETNL